MVQDSCKRETAGAGETVWGGQADGDVPDAQKPLTPCLGAAPHPSLGRSRRSRRSARPRGAVCGALVGTSGATATDPASQHNCPPVPGTGSWEEVPVIASILQPRSPDGTGPRF